MAIIAPWIQAPDVAGQYSRGLGLGAQIAQESERLKAENARTTMEAQARQESNMRQSELERARIATEQAYRTIQTNIAQERLNVAAKAIDARTKQAALVARANALFNQDMASGKYTIEQALARNPLVATQVAGQASQRQNEQNRAAALAQHRGVLEAQGADKVAIARAGLALRQNPPAKLQRTGETRETEYDPSNTGIQRQKITYNYGIPGAPQPVQAPANPKERKAGTVYMTPKGPHTWTGTGWQKPETEDQAAAAGTPPDAQ